MQAVLTQQKCVEALKGEAAMPANLTQAEKRDMIDKAKSAIVLCLRDKVLRDVMREPTVTSMWAKMESLFMTKSLAHRQLLKQQLYSFKMVESKSISEQLAEFNKILDDLANIEVNVEDEDKRCCYFVHYQSLLSISRIPSFMVRRAPLLWRKSKWL